ncbi:MAG: hypothetical protein B7X08_00390 [Acidocella sp. 20-63-7]|nr:MAG: hypothetical protein B7X08_00390 [Acidocella sp. 20-63-7]HQT45786.1 molybdenum cofactor guanylyltransferase MobA [Acidocella sp.]
MTPNAPSSELLDDCGLNARMADFLTSPPAVGTVILAGGKALRMGGGDKGRQAVGGQDILTRLVAVLRPQAGAMALSANGDPHRFADLGLPVLTDGLEDAGPLAGLLAGMAWARAQGFPWLLTAPTDTPFLPADLLIRLGFGVGAGQSAAIAASGGRRHPVVGLWSTELLVPLQRFVVEQGQRKMSLWAEHCGAAVVEWPDEPFDPFFNINHPAEREQAEALGEQRPCRVGAVVLPEGRGGQAMLADFAAAAEACGLAVGGLLQQGSKSKGDAPEDITLVALDGCERFSIMQTLARSGACTVNPQAVAEASAVLRRAVAERRLPILINKFGSMEVQGEGLADEMMAVMAEGLPLLITVSLKRLDAWLNFCGGFCELLPPDPAALRAWWERNRPAG